MSPDATQNPAQPLFVVCSGVPDMDEDDRSKSPTDCESNNASGPECVRFDGNDMEWCGKREVNDDMNLDRTSNCSSNSTTCDGQLSKEEETHDPLRNGVNDDFTEEKPSVQLKSVLVPVRDPVTKQIKHELVPIEIMDHTGLNIIKSVLIPVRDPHGAVCYEVKKVFVPIRPELTLPPKPKANKWADDQSDDDDEKDKLLTDGTAYDENKCQFCQKLYDTKDLLKKHIRRFHELSYRCVHCHQTYVSKTEYKNHVKTHVADTYVECPFCQQKYKRMCGLRQHQIRVHSDIDPMFVCDHCDKRFKLKSDMALHIDRVHMNVARACRLCGKFVRNVMMHEWRHEPDKKKKKVPIFKYFKCHLCISKFRLHNGLENHLLLHNKAYECNKCNGVFAKPSSLAAHKYRKHKPSILCTICKKSFKYRNNFYRHVLTHGGSRPYKCDLCAEDFVQKRCLIKHMKTHPGTLQTTPNSIIAAIARRILQDY